MPRVAALVGAFRFFSQPCRVWVWAGGAAVVLAVFFNNTFTYEPGREIERAWHMAALAGDRNARWLLLRNDVRWFFLLAMAGYFFGMNR